MAVESPTCCDDCLAALVGEAPSFKHVIARIQAVARSDAPALISGETGTGKELAARAIHGLSRRARSTFVAVNCGLFLDSLLGAELFGHERGAFTDADSRQDGLVAQAAGGTIFFDEVDALTPRAQVSLLRVIQDGTYRRLGSPCEQSVDVRFLAATNAPLEHLTRTGSFRADLFYRLSVFSLNMPPLRERREDILPLAEHFLRKYGGGQPSQPQFAPAAQEALLAFDWPGNVRELENTILRIVHLCPGDVIGLGDLGLPPTLPGDRSPSGDAGAAHSFKAEKRRALEQFERRYLVGLMIEHSGNVTRAARAARKERRDLGKLLKRHGIDPRRFRDSAE